MLGRFGPYELIIIATLLIIVALVAYLIFRDARKRGISDSAALIFVLPHWVEAAGQAKPEVKNEKIDNRSNTNHSDSGNGLY